MVTRTPSAPDYDLRDLMESFVIALRAAHRSVKTEKAYRLGVDQYIAWCEANNLPVVIARPQVQAWMADMHERGLAPNTVAQRLAGVRQLSKWMADPDEGGVLPSDPLLRLNAPKVDTPITPVLTSDQLKAMFKACQGTDFRDRRDEAMVRLMAETGARVNEVLGLDVGDVDMPRGLAYIRRGKGGKGRIVPFSAQTAKALDRYIRARRTHPGADLDAMFLTARMRRRLTDHGLRRTIGARAEAAGIDGFHPHMFRHTAASRWLAAGGSEGGLMAVAGWSDRAMLDRYVRATAAERAADEARGLKLGDL
jgi:site-specific recombinase XerD